MAALAAGLVSFFFVSTSDSESELESELEESEESELSSPESSLSDDEEAALAFFDFFGSRVLKTAARASVETRNGSGFVYND